MRPVTPARRTESLYLILQTERLVRLAFQFSGRSRDQVPSKQARPGNIGSTIVATGCTVWISSTIYAAKREPVRPTTPLFLHIFALDSADTPDAGHPL